MSFDCIASKTDAILRLTVSNYFLFMSVFPKRSHKNTFHQSIRLIIHPPPSLIIKDKNKGITKQKIPYSCEPLRYNGRGLYFGGWIGTPEINLVFQLPLDINTHLLVFFAKNSYYQKIGSTLNRVGIHQLPTANKIRGMKI